MLSDRTVKRKLVNFLATDILCAGQMHLKEGQRLVTAGGTDGELTDLAMVATKKEVTCDPVFTSNHEESDSRVWLHCLKSPCSKVLIYSPDTDTYHIGLRVLIGSNGILHKDAVVQLSNSIDAHECLSLSQSP